VRAASIFIEHIGIMAGRVARSLALPGTGPSRSAVLAALLAFLVTGALYLATTSRTVGVIDRGELAAVAATLGIAHPTGYPTLTLLGHLAVRLFPSVRPVLVLNVLSALWAAAGVGLAVLVIHRVLRSALEGAPENRDPRPKSASPKRNRAFGGNAVVSPSPPDLAFPSFFGAAFVGLSTTWWSQATGFEVYSLHAVFLTLVTLAFFRYIEDFEARNRVPRFSRCGVLFSLALGLSFTNHLSMVMLAPAFLFLYFRKARLSASAFRELLRLVPGFAAGLLPYAYLPLRSSMHPRLNWGAPSTLERFVEHVTGAQFHFAVLFEPRVLRQQTEYFVNTMLGDTSVVGLAAALAGIAFLARRAPVQALWTGILFVSCAALSALYDINDIGNYYLPAFLAVAIWIAAGLAFLASRFGRIPALGLGVVLVGLNAGRHYQPMNERDNTLAEDLARNVLENLPPNAVVFSNHWDYWVSASFYTQEVEGLRRDVLILDPEGLRSEPYLEALSRRHPDLTKPARDEVAAFVDWIRELRMHPTMTPAQAEGYYSSYYRMTSALIDGNPARPFFVTEWTDPRIGEGYLRVPMRLAYLLTREPGYVAQEFREYPFRPWRNRVDPYVVKISEIYTTSLLARARYEEEHGRPEEGKRYGLYALSFDPGFTENEVPDFPLHIEDQIAEVLRNYADLRKRVRAAEAP
jgi:hypothetical protein